MTGNKKMKYYAYFSANNGSTYGARPYECTNKKKAIAAVKFLVRANHFLQPSNTSWYKVIDENGIIVAMGGLYGLGVWTIDHDSIGRRN